MSKQIIASCLLLLSTVVVANGAVVDVAESSQFQEVYQLPMPISSPGWNTLSNLTANYTVNNAASIPNGSFTRVAYYMELSGATNTTLYPNGWIWVSFDAAGFQTNASLIGVPSTALNTPYQQRISNMNVYSNVSSIVQGTGITTGNIEFWGNNYSQAKPTLTLPLFSPSNASTTTYDFGDTRSTSGTHGSMQIHNYDYNGAGQGQTLFAYNAWGNGPRVSEMGIGTNPGSGAPDWTSTTNADDIGAWTTRTLQVFVSPIPEPGTWVGLISIVALSGAGFLRRRSGKTVAATI